MRFLCTLSCSSHSRIFRRFDSFSPSSPLTYRLFPLRDGAFVKEAMLTHRKTLVKPAEFYEFLDFYGKNIISTEGAEWLHHRSLPSLSFIYDLKS